MTNIAPPTEASIADHPMTEFCRVFSRNRAAVIGLVLFLIVLSASLLGPLIYGVDPFDIVWAPLTEPGVHGTAPLGTDYLGRDVLAGIFVGGKATLTVGAAAAIITVLIGLLVGIVAGYYGGFVDEVMMRITEFFQVLPPLLFAMVLVTLFSPSLPTVAVAIGIVSWPPTARLVRAEYMHIKQLEYVKAARAIGATNTHIIWRVILPNALPPLIVSATLVIGTAILFESGLSFLGLNDPNTMSWGLMIGSSREYFLDSWWAVTLPGVAIFLTVLSVSLIGDGINDAFNPRLRER